MYVHCEQSTNAIVLVYTCTDLNYLRVLAV